MENNKNKKSVKFQGDMLNFYDFIQVFVFTTLMINSKVARDVPSIVCVGSGCLDRSARRCRRLSVITFLLWVSRDSCYVKLIGRL